VTSDHHHEPLLIDDKQEIESKEVVTLEKQTLGYCELLKKLLVPGLTVFSVFTLTFMIFPGLTSKLQSQGSYVSSDWFSIILFVCCIQFMNSNLIVDRV
jgi:hypothetical protein